LAFSLISIKKMRTCQDHLLSYIVFFAFQEGRALARPPEFALIAGFSPLKLQGAKARNPKILFVGTEVPTS